VYVIDTVGLEKWKGYKVVTSMSAVTAYD